MAPQSKAPAHADEDSGLEDQAAALLKGFDSSSDEEESGDESVAQGLAIPELPRKKGLSKKLKEIKPTDTEAPGVVYIGFVSPGMRNFHANRPIVAFPMVFMNTRCELTSVNSER
jgi:nucleolar protein 15